MSIFGNIVSAILGPSAAAQALQATAASSTAPSKMAATPLPPAGSTDVAAVLNNLAARNKENLNWRTSIVDLMKLVGLDSSLSARKQLAAELHFSGDLNDSAAMNIWLHKQVMIHLAENGGRVPDELKH
jgi:hypothetical protein